MSDDLKANQLFDAQKKAAMVSLLMELRAIIREPVETIALDRARAMVDKLQDLDK